jgi:hypothetical protein
MGVWLEWGDKEYIQIFGGDTFRKMFTAKIDKEVGMIILRA